VTTAIDWTLDPADVPLVAPLRYSPLLFLGGYAGPAVAAAAVAAPALLSNPGLLLLCGLLVLVGGPFSLLYLWPMLRDPAQRPALEGVGWLAGLDPGRAVVAALAGTVASLGAAVTVGPTIVHALALGCLVAALPLVGLFDGAGEVDPGAGTLTFQERTVDVDTLSAVRSRRFDGVVVCLLSYVEGAGGVGRPYLVAVPDSVADDVLAVLGEGVAAAPDVRPREPDRTARVVLIGVALLSFATGASAVVFLREAAVLVALVTGGLGLLFAVGAYTVA
jgi:hypothetical protein